MSSIKSFWDGRAADPSLDPKQVTHPDVWQRWLEIETIKPLLCAGDRVIDIGCGAGYATRQFAPLVGAIKGVDFSAGMIERAMADAEVPANASFDVCDVLELSLARFGLFDLAISVRCLINLSDWATQQRAIDKIASIVRPGGRYIFLEGSSDGRAGLNQARVGLGLEAMSPVWHNVDFARARTLAYLDHSFALVREISFGVYDLIARIVHPLLVAPEAPRYDARINEVAARVAAALPGLDHLSRVLCLELERRDGSGVSRAGAAGARG